MRSTRNKMESSAVPMHFLKGMAKHERSISFSCWGERKEESCMGTKLSAEDGFLLQRIDCRMNPASDSDVTRLAKIVESNVRPGLLESQTCNSPNIVHSSMLLMQNRKVPPVPDFNQCFVKPAPLSSHKHHSIIAWKCTILSLLPWKVCNNIHKLRSAGGSDHGFDSSANRLIERTDLDKRIGSREWAWLALLDLIATAQKRRCIKLDRC
ncbi:hypothetical protein NL676_002300 [Syzygium grande]|nr:hypothetical protein NL676_002300 [Syzygium grande]